MAEVSAERHDLVSRCRRVVVKVGSAVVTGERGLNRVMIHRLADQVAELREAGHEMVVVSSGAVASGVKRLGFTEKPRTMPLKQAAAAVGQGVLMEAWEQAFEKHEMTVAQVLLTSDDLGNRARYLNARNTFEALLDLRIVPIVNENDTVVVEEIKFGDNDQLSALIAGLTGADLVVTLTDTGGLYDCDPRTHGEARIIPLVTRIDAKILSCATPGGSAAGTGGMFSKLLAARKCLASGIPMIIAQGRERDVLLRLFSGEELGTLLLPKKRLYQGKKLWLAGLSARPSGTLVLDFGAARALRSGGKSLLPVGIREVRGAFGVGAPVRCIDDAGAEIGVGLVNYRSAEIEAIMGRKTDELEGLLGYRHSDEVIHRNNFVLAEDTSDAE